jgi:integrase
MPKKRSESPLHGPYKHGNRYRWRQGNKGPWISTATDSEAEARALVAQQSTILPSQRLVAAPKHKRKYEDFVNDLIDRRRPNASERSKVIYRWAMLHHTGEIHQMSLIDIDDDVLRECVLYPLIAKLERGELAPGSIQDIRSNMTAVFATALNDRIITANPMKRIPLNEWPRREVLRPITMLSEIQARDYLFHAEEKYRALLATFLLAGLRIREALGLEFSDLDLEQKRIYVRRQMHQDGREFGYAELKTKRSKRWVPLVTYMAQLFEVQALRNGADGPIFADIIRTESVRDYCRKLSEQLGYGSEGLHPHALRHNYGSHLLLNGVRIADVSRQMGHKNPKITLEVYTHTLDELGDGQRTIDVWDRIMAGEDDD